ncbi:MAG: DNA-binding GntR family transcriptional regulator [Hyphomicrobiaceae bacterium]|jgi:DNA-binding GntR family transcriptional regulator
MEKSSASPSSERRINLGRELVSVLRGEIVSGKFQPGAPLTEPSLAKRFGISRAPVREALIALERDGLVHFKTTGRTRVSKLTKNDFAELMETRVALESMAARRAAAQWNEDDTAAIEQNILTQSKAATLEELSRLDIELHEYVVRHCGNERLLRLWQSIRWQFEMSLAFTHRLQQKLVFEPRQITVTSHRNLLAALASGKPEFAAQVMTAHIEESMEWSLPDIPADNGNPAKVAVSTDKEGTP